MIRLSIFNLILIIIVVMALLGIKKTATDEKKKNAVLLIAPLLTFACHYSSIIYHWLKDGTSLDFLASNPNLLLPIYPCNVVMWCGIIFGLLKNKSSKIGKFLADYLFWFGIFAALVGLFANVDFIRNPTFSDYDVTKGIIAHAFMLLNALAVPALGYTKIDLPKNYGNILLSMVMMFFIGCYCNIVFEVLSSREMALRVNSMFILQSPFPSLPFIRYPIICLFAAALYFAIFCMCEAFAYPKGERWISRNKNKEKTP